jgi:hypothetical protein
LAGHALEEIACHLFAIDNHNGSAISVAPVFDRPAVGDKIVILELKRSSLFTKSVQLGFADLFSERVRIDLAMSPTQSSSVRCSVTDDYCHDNEDRPLLWRNRNSDLKGRGETYALHRETVRRSRFSAGAPVCRPVHRPIAVGRLDGKYREIVN